MDNTQGGADKKRLKMLSGIYEVIETVAIAVIAAMLIFIFLFRISSVDGTSMWDTLEHNDRLIVSNLFYKPINGDIVVFQQEDGYFSEPLVKRVIAVGGQKLKIDFENWIVYVDGKMLRESYVTYQPGASMRADDYYTYYNDYFDEDGAITVPDGYVFVMGDNRNGSSDSRFAGVGFVKEDDIMGRAVWRLFPLDKMGKIS